jgi:O-antigen/teichoic acid export membrane protein
MKGQTSKGLRIAILVYTLYMVLYGFVHVIFPVMVGPKDPATNRIFGAAVLAFALGAWLAYREKAWDKVKIVVLVQVVFMILYTITVVWGFLDGGMGAEAWPLTTIGAVFAVWLGILYKREERIQR